MMYQCFLRLFSTIVAALPFCAAANLLSNPGFELGTGNEATSWSRFDSGGRETWAHRTGGACWSLYGWASNHWGGAWQDVYKQTSDTWYVFSVYACAETNFHANSVCLKLEWFDASSNKLCETERELITHLTSTWTLYTHMAKSPPGTKGVRVVMAGWNYAPPGGATVQMACMFDDADLTTTNIPETKPDIAEIACVSNGAVRLSWDAYRRTRHDAVWRCTSPGEWRKTYSADSSNAMPNAFWADTEKPSGKAQWFRVSRGEELIPGSTELCTATGDTGVTYLRFLPSSYTPYGTNPMVIAMDPNGVASSMMAALRHSAERFGWVVIACNTIQNGGDPLHDRRFDEILRDVRARIPHDERRVYLSGHSGGAYRSFEHVRYYWNEFAGVIVSGCWIGDYDDYTRFPPRLAITRLNGSNDAGGLAWEATDTNYFGASGCQWKDYHFDGGHQTAPPFMADQAFEWLNDNYLTNGRTYLATNHIDFAPAAFAAVQEAWRGQRWHDAATQAVHIVHDYPWSWEAHESVGILIDLFADSNKALRVTFDPAAPLAPDSSWDFMSRALIYTGGFPPERQKSLFELAVALNPSNAIACAYLSRILTASTPVSTGDLARATQLADMAILASNVYWRGWYARSWAAAEAGDYHAATGYVVQARGLTGRHPMSGGRYDDCENARIEFESHLP